MFLTSDPQFRKSPDPFRFLRRQFVEALAKYPQLVRHRVSLVRGQIRAVQFVDRVGDATRNPDAVPARQQIS